MKRIFCLLLCGVMLLGTVACSSPTDTSSPTNTDTQQPTTGETEPVETSVLDLLPSENYNNYDFNILTVAFNWSDYEQMLAEELTGEAVNDAVYKRNEIIKEKLGIKFGELICTDEGEKNDILKKQVMSNGKEYDMIQVGSVAGNALAREGYLADLNGLVNLSFDNPWWDKDFNSITNVSRDGAVYVAYGALSLPYVGSTFTLAFNHQIVKDYGLESPYTHWDNGTWTWDVMHQMCAQVNTDKNGDGSPTTLESDIFGLTSINNQISHFMMSSGVSLINKDDEGTITLNMENEKYFDVFARYVNTFIDGTCCVISGAYPGYSAMQKVTMAATGLGAYVTIFNEGRSLFVMTLPTALKYNRDSEVEFGIIGLPKYDEKQEDYVNVVFNGTYGVAVPGNQTDDELERTAAVLENLAAYSEEYVMPVYVENTLHYKYARDETSVRVLTQIMGGPKYCDPAFAYDWGGIYERVVMYVCANRPSIASALKGIEKKFNKEAAEAVGD